jgi:signal transduction histidine kinase
MLDTLRDWLSDPSGLTAHGFCLLWEPGLIWLHAVSDAAIGLAYFTIPLALAVFVSRRRDLVFKPVFVLFAAFIMLCGTGHWLDLLTLWVPAYRLEGSVKAATAAVSIVTAITLWKLMPQALLLPSPAQFRDVTETLSERDQQARELSRLNSDLEQFAYVASHDLKAPLHAIGLLAAWIGADIQGIADPATLENLRLMQQRAARLEMLIASLLSYARVGHGRAVVEAVQVGELVLDIVGTISPPPGFTVRYQGTIPTVHAQRPPLEHVLRNLITNAIKHHDRAVGEVTVSAHMTDGKVEFRVEDDGPGIAPEFHGRIFTIFQTLRSRDEIETSGMGLSIVHKIVERAGGRVWVESAPPTRGSVFRFTWPETVAAQSDARAA